MVHFDEAVDAERLPQHLAISLEKVKAKAVVVDHNRVSFKGGIFRLVTNWNLLIPFGFGDLTVDSSERQLNYRLSLRQLISAATLQLVGGTALAVAYSGEPPRAFLVLVPVFFAMVALMVGLNVLTGVTRFRAFLRRAVASAPLPTTRP
jgi:hypothetical protein